MLEETEALIAEGDAFVEESRAIRAKVERTIAESSETQRHILRKRLGDLRASGRVSQARVDYRVAPTVNALVCSGASPWILQSLTPGFALAMSMRTDDGRACRVQGQSRSEQSRKRLACRCYPFFAFRLAQYAFILFDTSAF